MPIAATVTATILDSEGLDRYCEIVFEPQFGAFALEDALVTRTTETVVTSLIDGAFAVSLVPGVYGVTIGEDTFQINVPDAGTYTLGGLIRS